MSPCSQPVDAGAKSSWDAGPFRLSLAVQPPLPAMETCVGQDPYGLKCFFNILCDLLCCMPSPCFAQRQCPCFPKAPVCDTLAGIHEVTLPASGFCVLPSACRTRLQVCQGSAQILTLSPPPSAHVCPQGQGFVCWAGMTLTPNICQASERTHGGRKNFFHASE